MVSRVALLVECHAHAEHVRQSSDRRNGPRSSTRPESACNPTSDSPSPFERSEFGGVPADHNGSDESLCKSILRMTSSRCQRRIVSGVTTVDTCLSKRRPSRCPSSPRRRRSSSSNASVVRRAWTSALDSLLAETRSDLSAHDEATHTPPRRPTETEPRAQSRRSRRSSCGTSRAGDSAAGCTRSRETYGKRARKSREFANPLRKSGGGGGSRTRVRKHVVVGLYMRVRFWVLMPDVRKRPKTAGHQTR